MLRVARSGQQPLSAGTRALLPACAAAAAAICLMLPAGAAQAQDKRVKITNTTHQPIVAFHSRRSGGAWTSNVLAGRSIRPGGSLTINFGAFDSCRFDIRAVFANGREEVGRNLDVCRVGSLKYSE